MARTQTAAAYLGLLKEEGLKSPGGKAVGGVSQHYLARAANVVASGRIFSEENTKHIAKAFTSHARRTRTNIRLGVWGKTGQDRRLPYSFDGVDVGVPLQAVVAKDGPLDLRHGEARQPELNTHGSSAGKKKR